MVNSSPINFLNPQESWTHSPSAHSSTQDNRANARTFTCLCYSADGRTILAGGKSKYLLLYDVQQKVLIKRFLISQKKLLPSKII